jgi:hypothetical protein
MVTRSQAHLHVACELAEPHHANETRHPLSFLVHCDQYRLAATSGESPSNSATTFEFSNIFEYLRISSNRSDLLRSALQGIGLVVMCLQVHIVVG